jgi:DNA-binding XRE family transcriptional regulator
LQPNQARLISELTALRSDDATYFVSFSGDGRFNSPVSLLSKEVANPQCPKSPRGADLSCTPFSKERKNKMIAIGICRLLSRFGSILGRVVTQKDRKRLGEGIRKYRKLERLTQEKLAEKVNLNPVYMGQIERGYKIPTVDALLRIAKALRVRLRDIVHEL